MSWSSIFQFSLVIVNRYIFSIWNALEVQIWCTENSKNVSSVGFALCYLLLLFLHLVSSNYFSLSSHYQNNFVKFISDNSNISMNAFKNDLAESNLVLKV